MKRTLAIIAALGLSTAVSGCLFSSEDGPVAQGETQKTVGPAWAVTLQGKCSDESADSCFVGHGFTVNSEGEYRVGPAPGGHVLMGKLSEEEMKSVTDQVTALFAVSNHESAALSESCQGLNAAEGYEQSLSLSRAGKITLLGQIKESQLCFQTANNEVAESLHDAISQLAREHYPNPFPDACLEAVASVQNLYAGVQSCSSDADCAYVTPDYEVIPASSREFVMTDACTLAKPLAVANFKLMATHRQALASALESARNACGAGTAADRFNTCLGRDGFMSDESAPSCVQNVCRIGASHPADPTPAEPAPANPAPVDPAPANPAPVGGSLR